MNRTICTFVKHLVTKSPRNRIIEASRFLCCLVRVSFQEQRDNDARVKEIMLRHDMLKTWSSELYTTAQSNKEAVSKIYQLCQEDSYFVDACILEDSIQTWGFMHHARGNFALLDTTDAVRSSILEALSLSVSRAKSNSLTA